MKIGEDFGDNDIARFLRARSFDCGKAKEMLENYFKWKKENLVELSLQQKVTVKCLEQLRTTYLSSVTDKFGRPVIVAFPSRHNPKKRNLEEVLMGLVYLLEEASKKAKPPHEKFVVLLNMQNFGLRNNDLSFLRPAINILQNYFPERGWLQFQKKEAFF